ICDEVSAHPIIDGTRITTRSHNRHGAKIGILRQATLFIAGRHRNDARASSRLNVFNIQLYVLANRASGRRITLPVLVIEPYTVPGTGDNHRARASRVVNRFDKSSQIFLVAYSWTPKAHIDDVSRITVGGDVIDEKPRGPSDGVDNIGST